MSRRSGVIGERSRGSGVIRERSRGSGVIGDRSRGSGVIGDRSKSIQVHSIHINIFQYLIHLYLKIDNNLH